MLCCIGDLVEDVVVWISGELAYGTDTPSQIFRRRGGSAASVAVQAAKQGAASRFVGQVGGDRLGSSLVAELEQVGVDVVVNRVGTTGSIVVVVDESGERTMLADRGTAVELDQLPAGALDDVTWLHIPAYSLFVEPLATTSLEAINAVRAQEGRVSIDASSVGPLADYGVDRFLALLVDITPDVLLCNQDEAELLAVDHEQPVAGVALTVVKAGPDPVMLVDASGRTEFVRVPPVEVVEDTTGAGDAFAAGFIVATMQGASGVEATKAACELAATVLVRPGAGS